MKNLSSLILFLFASVAHTFAQTTEVVCSFDHKAGVSPLVLNETIFPIWNNKKVRLSRAEFYISDVALQRPDGSLLPLLDYYLLVNAAQATAGYGAIVISLEPEKEPVSGIFGWSLAVTDHGRGMPPEILEKIFVPFYTTRSDGTGLGLPVVQHVALLHNGQVTVSSEPGRGTRIAIWLPDSSPATSANDPLQD